MLKHITERKGEYLQFVRAKTSGIKTGFPTLDTMIYGLQPGYHIIAARPSVGKTSLAMGIALNIGMESKKILFFSLEMNETSFIERLLSTLSGVTLSDIHSDDINEKDDENLIYANDVISNLQMYVDYKSSHNPSSILRQIEHLEKEMKFIPDVIFIDYIQYMKTDSGGHPTTPANLAEISRELVQIEKNLGIPMVVLCQLNRGADEYASKGDQKVWKPKVPRLSDLKGCVVGSTRISCLKREEYVADIQQFDFHVKVKTYNEIFNNIKFIPPLRTFYSGMKKCRKITTKSGKSVTVSDTTPIRAKHAWIKAKNLEVGNKIYIDKSV